MNMTNTIRKRTISLALAALIASGCMLNTPATSAATTTVAPTTTTAPDLSLGAAQGYNLVCFGNFTDGSTDIQGKSFIGGTITVNGGFTFGGSDSISSNDYALIMGSQTKDSFQVSSGSTNGKALVNSINLGSGKISSYQFKGGIEPWNTTTDLKNYTGIDLAADSSNFKINNKPVSNFQQQMIAKSEYLASIQATSGSQVLCDNSGILKLNGTDHNVNIFTIDGTNVGDSGKNLKQITEIHIDIPVGSTAVFNVKGDMVGLPNGDTFFGSGSNEKTVAGQELQKRLIWNFFEARTLEFTGSVHGSVLAPKADATMTKAGGGNFEGSLIVNSLNTSNCFQGHDYPFETLLTLTKTSKLNNWTDRTYDITLSAKDNDTTEQNNNTDSSIAYFSSNLYKYNKNSIEYKKKQWDRVINVATMQKQVPNGTKRKDLYFGNIYNADYNHNFDNKYYQGKQILGIIYPEIAKHSLTDSTLNGQIQFNNGYVQSDIFTNIINGVKDYNGKSYADKEIYQNVAFPFHKLSNGFYQFDSGKTQGTHRDDDGDNAKYDAGTNSIIMTKSSVGFWPFATSKFGTRYSFGMTMGIQFKIPQDGLVYNPESQKYEPMIFNFSGDDDVWIYVDGQLALDIGGVHSMRTGSINFATGEATTDFTWKLNPDGTIDNNTVLPSVTKNIYDSIDKNGCGVVKDGKYHSLKIFFLERGDGDSNFKLKFNLYQAKELYEKKTVKDYIDPRFEVVDEKNQVLKDGAPVGNGGTLYVPQDGNAYVVWKDQDISSKQNWNRTFRVKAKEEFIGGNNIPTNAPQSGVYSNDGELIQTFPMPTVNVNPRFYIGNAAATIFRGEVVPDCSLKPYMLEPYTLKANKTTKVTGQEMYILPTGNTGTFTYKWSNATKPADSVSFPPNQYPDDDTKYTLTATFTPYEATDESNTNSTLNGIVNIALPTKNVILSGSAEGIYTVNVVKGELDITKVMDKQYPSPNAQQSFVFKIERRNNATDSTPAETFYEVITPNDVNTDSTKKIIGLKKGYYKITEETGTGTGAWRYTQSGVPVDNDDSISDVGVVFIGRDTSSSSVKSYFGAQTGSTHVAAYPATIKFTNALTNDHWLGDTTVVVNNISQ